MLKIKEFSCKNDCGRQNSKDHCLRFPLLIIQSSNAGMTGAGTGDVLSGCVAGLLAKGVSAFDSACLGAYICGMAGDIAFESFSFGLIATDVIDNIPKVISSR